jgi:hypothetical protein
MTEVLKDKVQQIVNKTAPMVDMYLNHLLKNQQINPKQDTSTFEKFMMNLLEKLADAKTCPKMQKVYLKFLDLPQMETVYLLLFLFKPQSFMNKKSMTSHKHLTPRLEIILMFLKSFKDYEKKGRITKDTYPAYSFWQLLRDSLDA